MNKKYLYILYFSILLSKPLIAQQIHGNVTVGGYLSKERFKVEDGREDLTVNDNAITSARLSLNVSEIGSSKYEFNLDLRDKHDFFGKLDKERQTLTGKNTFQLRKFYFGLPRKTGVDWKIGRFAAFDQGVAYADGGEVGFRINQKWRIGSFAGLNPKEELRDDLHLNTDSFIAGVFSQYTKHEASGHYLHLTNALISTSDKKVESQSTLEQSIGYDRTFLFNQGHFHFGKDTKIFSNVYLDLAPQFDLQNVWVTAMHDVNKSYDTKVVLFALNSNEYSKVQELRDIQVNTSYKEVRWNNDFKFGNNNKKSFLANVLFGKRDADATSKTDVSIGYRDNALWSDLHSMAIFLGLVKNFTSSDQYFKFYYGYYRRILGFDFDLKYVKETYQNDVVLNPLYVDLGLSYIFSKKFFIGAGLQSVRDEHVTITSGLAKATYRFGNKQLAPIRDGAPPKGRL